MTVCPVRIDLHHHLLQNRRNAVQRGFDGLIQRLLFRAWFWSMQSPARYAVAAKLGNVALRRGLAGVLLKPWTTGREFPTPPKQSFRDYWREHEGGA